MQCPVDIHTVFLQLLIDFRKILILDRIAKLPCSL